jgi:transcriptional regulator with XRE-family HTH domain
VSIGDKVRATRKVAGISQEEVARRAGVSLNVINRLERGVILDPHFSTLRGIASALGVPVEDLVREPALAVKDEAPETGPEVEPEKHPSSPGHWVTVLARFPYENPEEWPYAFRKAASVMEEAHRFPYDCLSLRDNGELISVVGETVGLPEGAGEEWLTPKEATEIFLGMWHDRSRTPSS